MQDLYLKTILNFFLNFPKELVQSIETVMKIPPRKYDFNIKNQICELNNSLVLVYFNQRVEAKKLFNSQLNSWLLNWIMQEKKI